MTGYRRRTQTDSTQLQDLHKRHQEAIDQSADWLVVWTLFSEHPWLQQQLAICAQKAIRKLHAPQEWTADIKQEAMMRIGRLIQRNPTLGFDEGRGSYAGWIYRLLTTSCLKSLRQFRENKMPTRPPREEDRTTSPDHWYAQRIDLIEALEQLPKTSQQILIAYMEGQPAKAIAERHRISVRSVYRLLHEILEQLRIRLNR